MNCSRTRSMDRIESLITATSAAFLLVGVLTVGANVVARYALQLTLPWSAEAARYAIVWSALLGASVLVRRRQHLTVGMRTEGKTRTEGKATRLLDVVVAFGSAVFFAILAVSGVILVRNTGGETASSMAFLPMPVVYSVVPVSAFLMWSGAVESLVRSLYRDSDTNREHESP